jgi:DNA-binding MarR family transcriptional regulator/GNAT superfamily N-acetyltransferase
MSIDDGGAMSMQAHTDAERIAALRRFNRFYTRLIGLLREGINASSHTLSEARLIYELATGGPAPASSLCRDLGLDPGFVSRVMKRLEAQGIVQRSPSPADGRRSVISLTAKGQEVFARLDAVSSADAARLLAPLGDRAQAEVVEAMRRIERLLGEPAAVAPAIVLRPHRTGDLGWIAHRQGLLYAQEYGWDATYEALAAEILAGFVRSFDPAGEASWIAEVDGRTVGSIFLVKKSDRVAQLRLLYVEPSARGLGVGRLLVAECVKAARARGYGELVLWTQDNLHAARRIYEAAGFRLASQAPHHAFGKDLVGQMWSLDLTRPLES